MFKISKQRNKILFLGLDNGGKTSIILSLQKNKKINLLSYTSLRPTKKIDTTEIKDDGDIDFLLWDFGGQESLRIEYLKKLNTHLTGATKIIYVIDVQDAPKYDKSLEYFNNILNVIQKEKVKIKLSIFFHKFDPYLDIDVSELINKFTELIPPNLDFELFKTSIYTVFSKREIL